MALSIDGQYWAILIPIPMFSRQLLKPDKCPCLALTIFGDYDNDNRKSHCLFQRGSTVASTKRPIYLILGRGGSYWLGVGLNFYILDRIQVSK